MKRILAILFLFLLIGCGGSSDSPQAGVETPAENLTYNLGNPDRYDSGYHEETTVTGTVKDLNGVRDTVNISGSNTTEIKDKIIIDQITVIPIESMSNFTVDNVTLPSEYTTLYVKENHEPLYEIDNLTGNISREPIDINMIPPIGEIGDFGAITSWEYPNGDISTGVWKLESAGNNLANFITTKTKRQPNNSIVYVSVDTKTIDEEGNIIKHIRIVTDYKQSNEASLTYTR